ncbi:hypothetical protein DJ568_15605 [Mucilaginibacter hurinus]|uniref:Uncharacterized protein n=1 Tax=Mucilaginibacter hurinus TaxID=2201324 RepID=A0A367GKF8_9SPHI|nr:RICIN domain-containing protein [Mucilaginibacter hurinus]RCH53964.1 hypothetical protein DJ568_15605 [Mucilaginibacter hurinus]
MKSNVLITCLWLGCALAFPSCRKTESPIAGNGTGKTGAKQNNATITGAVPTGTFRIFTYLTWGAGDRTLGVDNNSYSPGAVLKQLNYVAQTSRDWRITDLGNGYHIIINAYTGQAVTIGNTAEHSSVIQYPFGNNVPDNQQWKIEYQGYGVYRIRAKQALTKGFHVDPSSTAHGATIKIQTYSAAIQGEGYFLLEPVTAAYMDRSSTNFFRRDDATGWNAGDGTNSVELSNGKVLWMMDDSNISTFANGTITCNQAMVNNVGLLQNKSNWTSKPATLLGAGGSSWVKSQPGTTKYNWITAGFQFGDIVYMYCTTMNGTTEVGPDLWARYQVSTNTVISYANLPATGSLSFGKGFVVGPDNYIYAYGTKAGFIVAELHVARFLKTAIAGGTWTYWNGSAWVTNPASSVAVGESAAPFPFVAKVGSKYVMVSTELSTNCGEGTAIFTSVSNSLTGPFTADGAAGSPYRKQVYNIPDLYNGTAARFYWGIPHPEYVNAQNELLITYNVNSDGSNCGTSCSAGRKDPGRYRPRGIRVPMSLIE